MWPLGSERNGLLARSQAARAVLLGTSCLFTAAMLSPARAGGLPSGGQVVGGQASISSPTSTSTVINQSSDKAIINWQDFSIATGNSVTFNQPGANSIALNRVLGSTPSVINGDLFANGHVWLINGNGVLFGKGAQVNVGSLIATTADMSNSDFMSGNYNFGSPSANPNAAIVNNGTIRANNGSIVLAGPVVANNGIIQADMGSVTLGGVSTFSVDFTGDNLLRFQVGAPVQQTPVDANGHPVKALVSNTGKISAKGGAVLMTTRAAESVVNNVINNTGMVEATSVAMKDGEVILDAGDGSVDDNGSIDVSGKNVGETGGSVTVEAKNITLADGAKVDASGDSGGGTVLIGGDAHGQGSVRTAQTTTIGHATITADAIRRGNGGKVVVWSDRQTKFAGSISARGGAQGGDGGFVETSGGHLAVSNTAKVDTLAPLGQTGTWLLDPENLIVQQGGEDGLDDGTDSIDHNPDGTDFIDPDTITSALATTNVSLEASNDITVEDDIIYSSTHSLNMLAEHSIDVLANIENTLATGGGAINLIAGWDGETRDPAHFTDAGVFGNNSGHVIVGGEGAGPVASVGAASGLVTVAGDNVSVDALGGDAQIGFRGNGGGNINVFSLDDVFVTSETSGSTALIGNGTALSAAATGNIDLHVGTTLALDAQQDHSTALIGNVSGTSVTGDVTITTGQYVFMNADGTSSLVLIGSNTGTANGDISVTSTSASINVTANGTDSRALIGDIASGSASGAIAITALGPDGGQAAVDAEGDGSSAGIGHVAAPGAGTAVPLTGDITVQVNGTASVEAAGANSYAQIGHHGAGSGNISISGDSFALVATGGWAQAGNGSQLSDIQGDVSGDLSVRIFDQSFFDSGDDSGHTILGNRNGGGGAISGNLVFTTGNIAEDTPDDEFGNSVFTDLSYGDVTVGMSGDNLTIDHGFVYNSPHNLTLLSSGNVEIEADVQNQGAGSVTAIGGWDGTTVDSAHLLDAGVFGNGGGVFIGSGNNDPSFGSKSGTTTVAGHGIYLDGTGGGAQIGFHGAGTGNINVIATGDLTVHGGSASGDYALIGNGSFDSGFNKDTSGTIDIHVGGLTSLVFGGEESDGGLAWIGNVSGGKASGNISLITGQVTSYGTNAGDVDPNTLGKIIEADLGTGSDTGGNFTLALTDPNTDNLNASLGEQGLDYVSPHDLTILSSLNITIGNSIQNSGTGNLTILAGWDTSVAPSDVLTTLGAYGNNGAFVWVVGANGDLTDYNPNADGDFFVNSGAGTAVGSKGGVTMIGGAQIYVEGLTGYGQIGYHGDGGSGAINVIANGAPGTGNLTGVAACFDGNANICVIGGRQEASDGETPAYAQIGNLGMGVAGTSTADINVSTTGNIAVSGGGTYGDPETGDSDGGIANAYGMIGSGDASQSTTQTVSGNINVHTGGQFNFFGSSAANSEAWLGNRTGSGGNQSGNVTVVASEISDGGTADVGQMVVEDLGTSAETGGDVTVGLTGSDGLNIDSPVTYSSPHTLSLLSTGNLAIFSDIQNSGSGNINLVAGWDGMTLGASHFLDDGVFGNNDGAILIGSGDVEDTASVGSKHGLTTVAGDRVALGAEGGNAQIGYRGTGNGNISVVALQDILVESGGGGLAQIGNGGHLVNGQVGGSITVDAGLQVILDAADNSSVAVIGNLGDGDGASESGHVSVGAGSSLSVFAGPGGRAQIGNATLSGAGGAANGDIDVTADTLAISSEGTDSRALIGDGKNNDEVNGDIDVSAGDIALFADGDNSFARIGHNPRAQTASVEGNITVTAAGSLLLIAGAEQGGGNAVIGSGAGGDVIGSVDVTAGSVTLDSAGDDTQTRIGNAGSHVTGDISVTAQNNISLEADGNSSVALITAQGDAVNGDITVRSQHGGIALNATGGNSNAQIGAGASSQATGDVTVEALDSEVGTVQLLASGNGSTALVGDTGFGEDTSLTGAINVNVANALSLQASGEGAYAQVGDHLGGSQTINVSTGALNLAAGDETNGVALVGNGAFSDGLTGNVGGDISLRVDGMTMLSGNNGTAWIGNAGAGASGNLVFVTGDLDNEADDDDFNSMIAADLNNGDVTLGFTNPEGPIGPDVPVSYDSDHTFNLLSTGDLVFAGSVRNEGSGDINVVAGWDGETLDPSHFGDDGVFGNNGHGVAIGLTEHSQGDASGVMLGSAGGTTSVFGDSLTLDGSQGYAQLGFNGAGHGSILVTVLGDVSLNGGDSAGNFAQIGNGGRQTEGSEGGDITVNAGGDVTLTGGSGDEAYVQIGHGGAEADAQSQGYALSGLITITGENVTLTAGSGGAAYAQVGHGGFKLGDGLTGGSEIGGNISIIAANHVSLIGGGNDAYAQIGNGGDQLNTNAGQNAHGAITGDITVTAPHNEGDGVMQHAGDGNNAYVQIGNGGYSINAPTQAIADNFTIGGNITVSDLSITGGGGENSYGQIGNGDNSHTSYGNISGDIVIVLTNGDTVTLTNGSGQNANANIHNATGHGTVTGTITGFTDNSNTDQGGAQGAIVTLTNNSPPPVPPPPEILPDIILASEPPPNEPGESSQPGPIEDMGGDGDTMASDKAADSLGSSLNGGKKSAGQILLGGILKQQGLNGASTKPKGVPTADEDFSSWGNEAFWQ